MKVGEMVDLIQFPNEINSTKRIFNVAYFQIMVNYFESVLMLKVMSTNMDIFTDWTTK